MSHSPQYTPTRSQQCPDCGSKKPPLRDNEAGDIVCMECGFVYSTELFDRGPEWRAFDREQREKRPRAGLPTSYTRHDKGLSTEIDWEDKDIRGKRLSPEQKAQMFRLRKWHKRTRVSDAKEKNLAFALRRISTMTNDLNLPKNILETASVIYRKAIEEELMRGRPIEGMSAGSIFVACRQCEFPITFKEIAQVSNNISKKDIWRSYRYLVKELGYYGSFEPQKPEKYVRKICNHLGISGKTEYVAHKIHIETKKVGLKSGRGAPGIAAASTYIASILTGEKKTQREIAEVAQVTEVTVRNRYGELRDKLLYLISL